MSRKRSAHLIVVAGLLLVAGAGSLQGWLRPPAAGGRCRAADAAAVSGTLNGVAATSARNAWAVGHSTRKLTSISTG